MSDTLIVADNGSFWLELTVDLPISNAWADVKEQAIPNTPNAKVDRDRLWPEDFVRKGWVNNSDFCDLIAMPIPLYGQYDDCDIVIILNVVVIL